MGHEIYRTDLSSKFEGKSFCEMASIIYNDFNGIIFGILNDIFDSYRSGDK
jgi:acetyl-CoA C-acetyltransferase/potassium large conductance calcium-activated channel subfamily M alpha protein 1